MAERSAAVALEAHAEPNAREADDCSLRQKNSDSSEGHHRHVQPI